MSRHKKAQQITREEKNEKQGKKDMQIVYKYSEDSNPKPTVVT